MPVGTGTTFSFAGLTATIKKIVWDGAEIETYDDSNLSTVGWVSMAAKKLAKSGPITLDLKWNSTIVFPRLGTSAAFTITPPSSARALTGTCVFKKIGAVTFDTEEDMTATAIFETSGAVTVAGSTIEPA